MIVQLRSRHRPGDRGRRGSDGRRVIRRRCARLPNMSDRSRGSIGLSVSARRWLERVPGDVPEWAPAAVSQELFHGWSRRRPPSRKVAISSASVQASAELDLPWWSCWRERSLRLLTRSFLIRCKNRSWFAELLPRSSTTSAPCHLRRPARVLRKQLGEQRRRLDDAGESGRERMGRARRLGELRPTPRPGDPAEPVTRAARPVEPSRLTDVGRGPPSIDAAVTTGAGSRLGVLGEVGGSAVAPGILCWCGPRSEGSGGRGGVNPAGGPRHVPPRCVDGGAAA